MPIFIGKNEEKPTKETEGTARKVKGLQGEPNIMRVEGKECFKERALLTGLNGVGRSSRIRTENWSLGSR